MHDDVDEASVAREQGWIDVSLYFLLYMCEVMQFSLGVTKVRQAFS